MEKAVLKATKRTVTGRKVKALRKKGLLPANVYGKKVTSCAIELPLTEFSHVYTRVHETGLIDLTVDGEKKPVLIHHVQYDPVIHTPLHVDFFQVDLKEKVTAKIPVELTGEAQAVKDKVGVLLTLLTEIEIEALPGDLPEKISVPVEKLAVIDEAVRVCDLTIASGVKVLTDPASEIVKVAPLVSKEAEAMAKEEAEKAAAAAAAAQPESGVPTVGEEAPAPETPTAAKEEPQKEKQ